MASGKSTVAGILSKLTSKPLFDTDLVIEKNFSMSCQDIFDKFGEETFRKEETNVLEELSKTSDSIISTGGGIVLNEYNRKLMKDTGIIVSILPEFEVIKGRLEEAKKTRPLLRTSTDEVEKLYTARIPFYKDCTWYLVPDIHTEANEIAEKIFDFLKEG